MSTRVRRLIHSQRLDIHQQLPDIDLSTLRQGFLNLMDSTARAVTSAGYDLDDVDIDRFVLCRVVGVQDETGIEGEFSVPAELADAQRLASSIRSASLRKSSGQNTSAAIEIIALEIHAVREEMN